MKTFLLLFGIVTSSLLANHSLQKERELDTATYPTYKVVVSTDNSKGILEGLDAKGFLKKHPYAAVRPEPFYYAEDIKKDREASFLVGGVNCDSTLEKVTQITGIPVDYLNKRAHAPVHVDPAMSEGSFPYSETPLDQLPAWWKGSQNVHMRASSEGFLEKEQSLKQTLLEDNKTVRELNLNHQKIAEPLLTAMENLTAEKKRGQNRPIVLDYGGDHFSVEDRYMDSIRLKIHKPGQPEEISYSDRHALSGWIGEGVQGSFFNDEIFSEALLKFTRQSDGKVFTIDGVTPHLIHRYGFYQGNKNYRRSPKTIADFFKIQGKPGDSGFEKCQSATNTQ